MQELTKATKETIRKQVKFWLLFFLNLNFIIFQAWGDILPLATS